MVELTTVAGWSGHAPKITVAGVVELVVKLIPVIVTMLSMPADVGVKEVITGGPSNINPGADAVPAGVVTDTLPLAPLVTRAVMVFGSTTVTIMAGAPPNFTVAGL